MSAMHLFCYEAKRPNLKLKTWQKQFLGSLPLAFALPGLMGPELPTFRNKLECFSLSDNTSLV
jgi:hypothetical protein